MSFGEREGIELTDSVRPDGRGHDIGWIGFCGKRDEIAGAVESKIFSDAVDDLFICVFGQSDY